MIDNFGSFSSEQFPHIYPFVQEYYNTSSSFKMPFRILDDSSKIVNKQEPENEISFHKIFNVDENSFIETQHKIQIFANGLKWTVDRLGDSLSSKYTHVRFGISIKTDRVPVRTYDNAIPIAILINYSRDWIPTWPRQTNIDIPMVFSEINSNKIIFCSCMSKTIQFHQYNDGKNRYISISSLTLDNSSLEVMLIFSESSDLKQQYCKLYPQHKNKIYPSDMIFNKLRLKFGIEIKLKGFNYNGFNGRCPTDKEVELYLPVLNEEISRYSRQFFLRLGLKSIVLCSDIHRKRTIASGFSVCDELIINISNNSETDNRITVHHEIFHLIEKKVAFLLLSNSNDSFCRWNFTKWGNRFTDVNEYKAHLFACKITEPDLVNNLSLEDKSLKINSHKMDDFIKSANIEVDSSSKVSSHIPISLDGQSRISNVTQTVKIPDIQLDRKWIFVGMKGPAISVVKKLVKNKFDFIIINKENADQLSRSLIHQGLSIMLVTHNIIDWSIWFDKNNTNKCAKDWLSVYEILFPRSTWHIRYEDITQLNTKKINDALNLCGLKVTLSDLDFVNIEDSNPYNRAKYFSDNLWNKIKTKELIRHLGYCNYSCED